MICPQCRSADCFRSRRGGVSDFLFSIGGFKPWRCHTCDLRFYAGSVALAFSRYAHCPRCGNFEIDAIPRDRVERGAFLFLKRLLGFPAYRCDPCRERFFTLLPVRRIVPSMASTAVQKPSDA
jgi:putative component of membrane protein insertase Oxa1/YidC/SpoIIIJ protein YidD